MRKDALIALTDKYNTNRSNWLNQCVRHKNPFAKLANHQDISYFEVMHYLQNGFCANQELSSRNNLRDCEEFKNFVINRLDIKEILSDFDGYALKPLLGNFVLPFLNGKTIAVLSSCSSSLYNRVKSFSVWRDKFLNIGCNKESIEQIFRARVVDNPKILYGNLLLVPPHEIPNLDLWEICFLTGEMLPVEWVREKVELTEDTRGLGYKNPLHYAAVTDSVFLIKYCINDLNIPEDSKANFNETILHIAAKSNSLLVLRYGVEVLNLPIYKEACYGANIVLYAGWVGAHDTLAYCLKDLNMDIYSIDRDASTLLDFAAWSAKISMVKYCLDVLYLPSGLADTNKMTELHFAAWGGDQDVIKYIRYKAHLRGISLKPRIKDGFNHDSFWYLDQAKNINKSLESLQLSVQQLSHEFSRNSSSKKRSRGKSEAIDQNYFIPRPRF